MRASPSSRSLVAVVGVVLAGLYMASGCANQGEPFVPIHPGEAESTKVYGTEYGHWTLKNSPYYVMASVLVPETRTLIIDPGVQVVFIKKNQTLTVRGRLHAVGTSARDSVITFRPTSGGGVNPAPGDWGSLVFEDSRPAGGNQMSYVRTLFATTAIVVRNSSLAVDHSILSNNLVDGVSAQLSSVRLADCTIANNGQHGVTLDECDNPPHEITVDHCNIGNNVYAGIWAVNSSANVIESDVMGNGFDLNPNLRDLAGGLHFEGRPGVIVPIIRRCNLDGNRPCEIRNIMGEGIFVAADSNYWGPITTDAMNQLSNPPHPDRPVKSNCSFNVPRICDALDVAGGTTPSVLYCWWADAAFPNFPSSAPSFLWRAPAPRAR